MKHFYLLRHTEFENPDNIFRGRLGLALSKEGKDHARRIGAWFKDKHISKIYSSAVERCKATAEIVAQSIDVPVVFDKRLLEVMHAIQGMNLIEYRKDRNKRYSLVDTLGGESMMDVQVRMLDFFYEAVKRDEGNSIICSHGDGLYFLYLALVGKNLPEKVGTIDRSEYQEKGTVRRIDVEGDQITVGSIEKL
ncbi:MAG: histidine phosphatase family protein [Candidatus Komeilibacteria bacterium]|nr:histidine phosphatase family protein [Candidatus Komeilibacteria bacterium]